MSALVLVCVAAPAVGSRRAEIEPGLVALRTPAMELYLEALPRRGEGLLSFTRRLCGSTEAAGEVAGHNGTRRLLAGIRYKVPFELLDAEHQARVLGALFPQDRGSAAGWRHQVSRDAIADGLTLWRVAEWFTGSGQNFPAVRSASGLVDDSLVPGQVLLIPSSVLRPALRSRLPAPAPDGARLEFRGSGDEGFAVYRLRPGEALYSSVVVRFTGRIYAEDVNALATEIAELSGIEDVTDIPIGYEIRVPTDLLLPEHLPAAHPRRVEYETALADSRAYRNEVQSKHLEGITVVLDAGHGGADVGASKNGVWESLYVYDIMLRARDLLESRTSARVVPTLRDGGSYQIQDRDVLPYSRGHQVLTTPPYAIEDSKVGVNLRWYLANSVFRGATKEGTDPKKVVFVSIHADSLHPSLRGAMFYIPSTQLTAGRYGRSGAVYSARAEYREQPRVEYSWRQRTESEGLSRDLATRTLRALEARQLAVHPYKPIREKIIRRRGQEFVPAVLRYNAIPAKMLFEVCNLANAEDRRLIQTQAFRQRVAESLVEGILAYYGEELPPGPPVQVARAAR